MLYIIESIIFSFFKIDTSVEKKNGQRMLTTDSTNRSKKQKVRRGEAMQIKTTVKAEIFSPGRLAKIKEINYLPHAGKDLGRCHS